MTEEGMPPTPEEMRQLHRSLTENMLDKAASDPQWKQLLLDDPEAAFRTANFPETQKLEEWRQSARSAQEGAEVQGQISNPLEITEAIRSQPEIYGAYFKCLATTTYWGAY